MVTANKCPRCGGLPIFEEDTMKCECGACEVQFEPKLYNFEQKLILWNAEIATKEKKCSCGKSDKEECCGECAEHGHKKNWFEKIFNPDKE